MRSRLGWGFRVVWLTLGLIQACSLASEVPSRPSDAPPASSPVTLSGAGGKGSGGGSGDHLPITDIARADREIATGGNPGGIDSGGAPDESAGGIGGAASTHGGAAGTGGLGGAGIEDTPASGAAGVAGTIEPSGPQRLFFSEYIEGSSANKALELVAVQHAELEGCKVLTYFNGKSEPSVVALLSGSLEAGEVLTLCTSTLKQSLAGACQQVGNLTFNGNDAVALSCAGQVLDLIGEVGLDPGTAWGTGTNTTLDHTLRRKCKIHAGTLGSGPFDPSREWDAYPIDSFGDLGSRGC